MNEAMWVSGPTAQRLLGNISRMELYRRTKPGESGYIITKPREDGKPGLLYAVPSMDFEAQKRFRQEQLRAALAPAPEGAPPGQSSLFPEIAADKEAASALGSGPEIKVGFFKLNAIQPLLNHDTQAQGLTKREIKESISRIANTPVRTIEQWRKNYREKGFKGLLDKRPGPAKHTGEKLDASMKGYLQLRWLEGLTYQQCYRALLDYLNKKQDLLRAAHTYWIPSLTTVKRFIYSLDEIDDALREGPDALKAACGHIDRSYLDLAPLERVESDECKLNLFAYDPRRPVNRKGKPWIRRYWLLTFYDTRSMFPLVWNLCEGSEYELRHGIAVEDEINLFVALIQKFGIPRAIQSDRGRFRGKDWGGEPYQQHIDKEFAPANGILQRVGQLAGYPEGIRHDMPRIHNPRGTRLERFHRWVADWFRGKPGWIGANTRERKMTRGDADAERHKLWCVGQLAPGEPSPLLTRDEILVEVNKMMEAWRDHNSEGTDMYGLTPRAVFAQCSPQSGFPQISEDDLAFATAQHFENERIEIGGIIELRKGERYFHPLLIPLAGQKREVVRLRNDHSFITVLPASKGEETIVAQRRARVGMNEPDELSRAMELQNRLCKLAGEFTKPLEYDPGAQFPDAEPRSERSKSVDVIQPSESIAAHEAPPLGHPETSSVEYLMEHDRYKSRVKPMTFADLEYDNA